MFICPEITASSGEVIKSLKHSSFIAKYLEDKTGTSLTHTIICCLTNCQDPPNLSTHYKQAIFRIVKPHSLSVSVSITLELRQNVSKCVQFLWKGENATEAWLRCARAGSWRFISITNYTFYSFHSCNWSLITRERLVSWQDGVWVWMWVVKEDIVTKLSMSTHCVLLSSALLGGTSTQQKLETVIRETWGKQGGKCQSMSKNANNIERG